jgi:septal ring factor EnvC (AmiA/AmiB activator)
MKKSGRLALISLAVFTIFAVSACGVNENEYEGVVAELENTKAELEQANSRIAELEESLELSKMGTDVIEKLKSSQQKAVNLSSKVKELAIENERLKKELAEIKTRIKE